MRLKFEVIAVAVIILLAGLLWLSVIWGNEYKNSYERTYKNEQELMKADSLNKSLIVTKEEMIALLTSRQDSLLDSLKIKPKFIDQYITIETIVVDTDTVEVPIKSVEGGKTFVDSTNCFVIKGKVYGSDITRVDITSKQFSDSYDIIFHKGKRAKINVFWIPLRLGKREPMITGVGKCSDLKITSLKVQ